jgi:hypothetical protein
MAYVTVCLDHASFQVLGMQEPENECVKRNGTMHRKADGGGFWCVEM